MTILIITTFVYSSQMYQTIPETFKDIFSSWWFTVTYQQSYHFSYIHLTNNCSDSVQILVAVCSAPINILRRNTIRETWGQYARNNSNFKMVFFEGVTHSPGVQDDIHEESVKYGDIVQENYIDHYENLSLKSIAYLRWVSSSCRKVKFVLKTDDDMYINLPLLEKTLMNMKRSRFIMGLLFQHVVPIRHNSSKWYTPISKYQKNEFPDYMSGTAYLISGDIVPELYAESFNEKLFWLEDVYITGMLANRVNATRINSNMFTIHNQQYTGCAYRNIISGHHVTPKNMKIIYQQLKDVNLVCH
ncbi:beta-1,3-galactosyltransferase 1-like [Octopus sinensis]|uniref:Hexosyltransferase n=1 Tax=Octopus sinensis TaxID=2607531 RepID=A0A7E6ENN1_9MOLL|nr:beta-1,3-galactosyltransferase 1-like [Octopus sinensis]